MTQIATLEDLYRLPGSTSITDANGDTFVRHSGPKPTTNPNWIAWQGADGVMYHSDQIALPVEAGSAA